MSFTWWRYPRRRFEVQGTAFEVRSVARSNEFVSQLFVDGSAVSEDRTPVYGPEAIRNHVLRAQLPDGREVEVETGYVSLWTTGAVTRLDGERVYESHPGRAIAYPEKYREQIAAMAGGPKAAWQQGLTDSGTDWSVWKRNRVALGVDVVTGLLFFVVAKMTDLTTAALVGAAVGIALVVAQRFVKVDLLGGLAMFGIVMMLISAGLAFAFQDEDMVKLRGTITGLIAATLFLGDGLAGGKRLGAGMARYMPYSDLDPGRLAVGMGVLGLLMAGLNFAVARLASTDVWLFYSTFVDFLLIALLATLVIRHARGGRQDGNRDAPA